MLNQYISHYRLDVSAFFSVPPLALFHFVMEKRGRVGCGLRDSVELFISFVVVHNCALLCRLGQIRYPHHFLVFARYQGDVPAIRCWYFANTYFIAVEATTCNFPTSFLCWLPPDSDPSCSLQHNISAFFCTLHHRARLMSKYLITKCPQRPNTLLSGCSQTM